MNILVTGGAGYIGSHAVRSLKKAGYDIVIFDNLSSGHAEAVRGFELIEGDLADQGGLDRLFADRDFDAVVHFAGSIEAGASMTDPKRFFDNNLRNGLNLLDTMLTHDVKKIVFSSTAAVYGEPEKTPITEDTRKKPTNVYGLTKLMFEQALEAYDHAYGLRSVSLRYFNAAGADQSGEIGEAHPLETHLVPLVLEAAIGKRAGIRIFGTDYPTPDGTCIRDYVHVSDLADAHALALDYLEKHDMTNVFNLGNGTGISVREVINATKRITETDFPVIEEPRRDGDPARLYASPEKAKRELGWKPEHDTIDAIIRTAWRWHENHPEGFRNA